MCVCVCVCFETSNMLSFMIVISNVSCYFYYIEGIYLQNIGLTKNKDKLNKMQITINFTYEIETNIIFLFLIYYL